MDTIKFADYNVVLKEIISEEDTLQNIIDVWLDGKPSKEEKEHLSSPEDWAKYAFENNNVYYLTIYREEKPYACIVFSLLHITIRFLDYYNEELICYLLLVYHRSNLLKYLDNKKIECYENNNLFLGQINLYTSDNKKKSNTEIVFNHNGIAEVTMTQATSPDNNDWNTVEKTVDVNVSHNFIRPPKDYKDFFIYWIIRAILNLNILICRIFRINHNKKWRI